MSLLAQVKKDLPFIVDDVLELEVSNHSTIGAEWVTVEDMMDGAVARNNCWATSNAIYEDLDIEAYTDIDKIDIVGVVTDGNSHYAVYLAKDDEEVVLDFTARQFDAEAPFPFVVPLNVWKGYVEHMVGKDMELYFGD